MCEYRLSIQMEKRKSKTHRTVQCQSGWWIIPGLVVGLVLWFVLFRLALHWLNLEGMN